MKLADLVGDPRQAPNLQAQAPVSALVRLQDSAMHVTQSYSATFQYRLDSGDVPEIPKGYLPVGFLALDLARALGMKLYDPDKPIADGNGIVGYEEVDPTIFQPTATLVQRPSSGNGLIGDKVHLPDGSDAKAIIAAYGGSDLIYVPDSDVDRVRAIADFLTHQDYVGGIFVDADRYRQCSRRATLVCNWPCWFDTPAETCGRRELQSLLPRTR